MPQLPSPFSGGYNSPRLQRARAMPPTTGNPFLPTPSKTIPNEYGTKLGRYSGRGGVIDSGGSKRAGELEATRMRITNKPTNKGRPFDRLGPKGYLGAHDRIYISPTQTEQRPRPSGNIRSLLKSMEDNPMGGYSTPSQTIFTQFPDPRLR